MATAKGASDLAVGEGVEREEEEHDAVSILVLEEG